MSEATEGKFKFRIKPNIEHAPQFINRAIEEIQEIIVSNKDSADKLIADCTELGVKISGLEIEIEALKQIVGEKNKHE